MNRKLSFVIILIFVFSLIPIPVYAAPRVTNITDQDQIPINWGIYGNIVYVYGDGVTSGSEVKLYWDFVQDWDGEKGLLNTTEAGPDGTF